MIDFKSLGLFILLNLLFGGFLYAQEEINNPEDIVNITAIPYRLVGDDWVKADPENDPVRKGERIRVQLKVEMSDGSALYTKLPGHEGTLKFNQFKIETEGIASPGVGARIIAGNELQQISKWEYNLNHDGRLSSIVRVSHKKNKDKYFDTYWPVSPRQGDMVTMWYSANVHEFKNGVDLEVEVTIVVIEGKKYLKLVATPIGDWTGYHEKLKRTDAFYLIDVEKEKVLIAAFGQDGGSPGDQSNYKTVGDEGYIGGFGGNITLILSKEAKQYAHLIYISNFGGKGGRGGKGSISYGPNGPDGEKGSINIIVEGESNPNVKIGGETNSGSTNTIQPTTFKMSSGVEINDGIVTSKHGNGQIDETGAVNEENVKIGKWVRYYQDGSLREERYYNDKGILDGFYKELGEDGTVIQDGEYLNGEKSGEWTVYNKDGSPYTKAIYDPVEGTEVKTEYDRDGKIISIVSEKDGTKDGKCEYYSTSTGLLVREEIYLDGELHGMRKLYDKNGDVSEEAMYSFDKRDGEYRKYTWGKLVLEGNYTEGEEDGEFIKYDDEKIKERTIYVNGNKHGKYVKYDSDGNILEEGQYINNNLEGEYKKYKNGKLIELITYKNGDQEGKYIMYHTNGKKKEEGEYVDRKKEGEWVYYNEDGSVKEKRMYEKGKLVE